MAARRLHPHLAAEITDVDLARIGSADAASIRERLWEHQVLVFRKQALTMEQHLEVSRVFGPLETWLPHPSMPDQTLLFPVSNRERDGFTEVGLEWHTDSSWRRNPTQVSILYSRVRPEVGGDTLYVSTFAAWEIIAPATRARIETLRAVQGSGVLHPLVRVHPISGRKALYIDFGLTIGIEGLDVRESEALLAELKTPYLDDANVYRHRYEEGDFLLWDNASVAHKATVTDPTYPRLIHRTSIEGREPVGVGGLCSGDPASPGNLAVLLETASSLVDQAGERGLATAIRVLVGQDDAVLRIALAERIAVLAPRWRHQAAPLRSALAQHPREAAEAVTRWAASPDPSLQMLARAIEPALSSPR